MKAQDRTITTNGIRLYSQSLGEDDSPPVLMVMGATASLAWWPESLIETLAYSGCRVIRYDHRDTGQSTTFAPGTASYSVEDMVDDLWAVADGYGLDRFHLVGMSLGGLLGQIAALQQPERLISLTLIAAQPLDGSDLEAPPISAEFLSHFQQMDRLDWGDQDGVIDYLVESARLCAGSGQPFLEEEARQKAQTEVTRASHFQSAFHHSKLSSGQTYAGRMGEIATPCLVLQGDEDPIVARINADVILSRLPNARLHIVEGLGHELPSSRVPEIATEILDFLAQRHRQAPAG